MFTLGLGSNHGKIRQIIDNSIQESIPRKYKRTAFIASLIYLFESEQDISHATFKKIVRLFEMGIKNERSLRYTYYIRNYIWSDLVKSGTIEINGKTSSLLDFIKLYRGDRDLSGAKITEQVADAVFSKIPDFIKYGSDRLMRHDILNVLFFIRHKNSINP